VAYCTISRKKEGEIMTKYRYSIGLDDKYLFGTELEFTNVYLDDISKLFRESPLPVRYALHHKSTGFTKYDEWYLDMDSTVTKRKEGRFFGGELSSRILTDKKEIWIELKDICYLLRKAGATINDTCSNHIRVNLSCIKNEPYFFEVLSKIIALYEIEIKSFYMGDDYLTRSTSFDYARLLSGYLIEYINNVNFYDPDCLYQFRHYRGVGYFTRRDAINLQDYDQKKLMEVRYANGSLNEKIIQNNINFTLKLVDAIQRELFDTIELSREVNRLKESDWYFRDLFEETSYNNFERLVKNISTSSEDVDDFMSQYENVLSKRPRL